MPTSPTRTPDARTASPDARQIAGLLLDSVGRTSGGRQPLPEDLLREAAHRLGVVCLAIAALCAAEFALVHLIDPLPGTLEASQMARHDQWVPVFDAVAGTMFLLSLALFWYTRRSRKSPQFLLDLALGYEVLIALLIGLLDYAVGTPAGVSWIAIIILLFPSIIPSRPWKTFVAALLAASMDPVGALFWKSTGVEVPSLAAVMILAVPNYLCAGLAPVVSHIITRLGREVRKAREMGSYVLGDLIASGGMGEVWQATHRFLARPAAVKLIKPDVLGTMTKEQREVLVQRFHREARAAANLRSPHTIQLFDFGVTDDGTFYYVMELLNGMDLQSLVEEYGPIPPPRTVHILRQACESLAEAHDRGLIHRDIKPGNIQVCCMGHYFDYVKVLDFGLVKSQAAAARLDPGLTAPNVVAGTPAYMSPEGALGEPVDQRTDIYALGCVAYWMLTGRQVFEGQGVVQLMARHIHTPPEPPSLYSLVQIPSELEELVLACLSKQPEDRPASARELADRLAQCEVESEWSREHARLWWESRLTPEPAVTFGD
jgi:eukaryotic-like serine/threonine-protein kinase